MQKSHRHFGAISGVYGNKKEKKKGKSTLNITEERKKSAKWKRMKTEDNREIQKRCNEKEN